MLRNQYHIIDKALIAIFYTLCYLITLTTCQQCLSLSDSRVCSMFSTSSISIRNPKYVTLPFLVNVSTVSDFDHQLLNYVNSTSFWDLELGCKSATIHNRARYSVSLTCATIVFDPKSSAQCNSTTLPIPICQSTCEAYSKSVESILNSSPSDAICNLNGGNLITAGANSLSQQCNTNEGLKGQARTGCLSGFELESRMCGFGRDLDTLCRYCNNYDSTVSCCREFDCMKTKDTPALSGGDITGIVLGAVGGLALCGFVVFCCIRRKQKKQCRPTHPNNDYNMYSSSNIMKNNSSNELDRIIITANMNNNTSSGIPNSSSTLMLSNSNIHNSNGNIIPEAHMMRNVYPIDDDDYMEVVPDINIGCDIEAVKGHVFKVNSLEKQFVRVIYQLNAPENPDELELLKGDIIRMYYYFDDGWAFGDNFGSGLRGLFPILCVVNLTPEEVQELLCFAEIPDEGGNNNLSSMNHEGNNDGEFFSSVRHFSTGVQYDLDPKATIRLQNLRRTITYRDKHSNASSEENNFQYLCAASSSYSPLASNSNNTAATLLNGVGSIGDFNGNGVPPQRTASMHAAFNPRRSIHSNLLQDPLYMQEEEYFRSESSGSTAVASNTPDSKSYLNGY